MVDLHGPKYRIANWLARWAVGRASLDPVGLLAEAESATGLCDWGDPSFRQALQILLDSIESEAFLNDLGRHYTRRQILRSLRNRLQIRNALKENPTLLKVQIERPLVITGLARSGTTFLHRLLAQDPANRTLQLWELLSPVPSPEIGTYAVDPRRKALRRGQILSKVFVFSSRARSQLSAIHEARDDSPEECWPLFHPEFLSNIFSVFLRVPKYARWLESVDMRKAYQSYYRTLQLLLWRFSADHLVVKSPEHLRHLDCVIRVFPDARIVWVHRDPMKTIPSACSLVSNIRQTRSYVTDPLETGESVLQHAAGNVERAMNFRNLVGDDHFCDVQSFQLREEPISVVRRIYESADYQLCDEAIHQMQSWLKKTEARGPHSHSYQLSTYGLTAKQVESSFSAYREHFEIRHEQ